MEDSSEKGENMVAQLKEHSQFLVKNKFKKKERKMEKAVKMNWKEEK